MELEQGIGSSKRSAGILLHPSSFPGPYGIGDLGKKAYEFIDFLKQSGMKLWEVLPLGPTAFSESPFQVFSSFAGNPYLISPDHLKTLGLLFDNDFQDMPQWNPENIHYGNVITFKQNLLKKAYSRFIDNYNKIDPDLISNYNSFLSDNSWLSDYCLFMAAKDHHKGAPWYSWEASIRCPSEKDRKNWEMKLKSQIAYYSFIQFLFFYEWDCLKKYANKRGITIIGEIPFYVGLDSVDVWANKELFLLDKENRPLYIAGLPPDYFLSYGKILSYPLYNWQEHKKQNFDWWKKRIARQLSLTDQLKLSNFKGFIKSWAVASGDKDATNGHWLLNDGELLFKDLKQIYGPLLPFFTEDLGPLDEDLEKFRKNFNLADVRVLLYAFDAPYENHFLPHNHTENSVCYASTHDTDTCLGWYKHAYETSKDKLRRYYSTDANDVSWVMIRAAFSSVAKHAVITLQDILSLDSWARYNDNKVTEGNWGWRYKSDALNPQLAQRLYDTAKLYGR